LIPFFPTEDIQQINMKEGTKTLIEYILDFKKPQQLFGE
jgi:hypothetical protein